MIRIIEKIDNIFVTFTRFTWHLFMQSLFLRILWSHLVINIILNFWIQSDRLTLISYFLWYLSFLQSCTFSWNLITLLWIIFLSLDWTLLLYISIVFLKQFSVESCTKSRHSKSFWYISTFKSLFNFLFENYKLILHFRINIPFIISWPKSPECITDNITMSSSLFSAKNVFP